jgi:glucosyltransferase
VFNKELYLKDVINGFLSQNHDFTVEIILADDCSTDGSRKIIEEYAKSYPEVIKPIYNDKNVGVTKNWITACKIAEGEYIARCDGDDPWIYDNKLKDQVNILKNHAECKVCYTDFDVFDESTGEYIKGGFRNGLVHRIFTFEEMLVELGFTMASTWLVDREFMIEINSSIDSQTSDDTFDIQLEFFKNTELHYYDKSTVLYNNLMESDSKSSDREKYYRRHKKLFETQIKYANKYEVADSIKDQIYRKASLRLLSLALDQNDSDMVGVLAPYLNEAIDEKNQQILLQNEIIKQRDIQISKLESSHSIAIGRILTFIPRKIKEFLG